MLSKINCLLACCLAIVFLLFFQFTKHDAVLSSILPYANDPYDAVGSFAVIIAGLLSALCIVRAIQGTHTNRQKILIARTQFAVAAAVLVTLVADSVAMVRHVPMWLGKTGATELIALMIGVAALALGFSLLIRVAVRDVPIKPASWTAAAVVCILATVVLALYPESLIDSTAGELFTLLAGILLLFIPLTALPGTFLAFESSNTPGGTGTRREVVVVTAIGLFVGIALLAGEWRGEGAPVAPAAKIMIASIFIIAPIVGLWIAYYALRKPLALFRYG